jgi:hypothetical protein
MGSIVTATTKPLRAVVVSTALVAGKHEKQVAHERLLHLAQTQGYATVSGINHTDTLDQFEINGTHVNDPNLRAHVYEAVAHGRAKRLTPTRRGVGGNPCA